MADMIVKTNRQFRSILNWWDLTEKEKREFDYFATVGVAVGEASFIRYKGSVYDLGEFQTTHGMPEFSPLKGWHAYRSDCFYAGVVVKFSRDQERVMCGTFYC